MKFKIFLLIIFVLGFVSCSQNNKVTIALSKSIGSANYEAYNSWLQSIEPDAKIINLYGLSPDEAVSELRDCDGLVLTGGPDVHPVYFNKTFDTARCQIDNYRDTLEFALIKEAEKMKIPILGICRGAQIFNVAYGGSLIVDIPEDTDSEISHQAADGDMNHNISVVDGSLLHKLSESLFGIVNSNHHQSVDRLADIFVVSATSPDGIIEAYEYKDNTKPFFLGVQWHPERLEFDSRFSAPIGVAFINAVKKNKKLLAEKK